VEDVMEDQPTCGKGLAAHASLPALLGDVMSSMAEVLAHHMTALDLGDPNTRAEYEAYGALVDGHRTSADQLHSIALRMAASRDLPMGRHDVSVMGDETATRVLERLVQQEEALVAVLRSRVAEHRAMLSDSGS
jgi:hypothetical protein